MASRASGKTSTVLSKTTGKIIFKKSPAVVTLSSEEKAEALAKKKEAIEEARRRRAASALSEQSTKVTQSQPASFAITLGSQVNNNNVAQMVTQKSPPAVNVWPLPASNAEYQKLSRPQTSVCGASAVGNLLISARSALGPIPNNVQPQVARSQGTVVANGDRPTDRIYSQRDYQVGAVFSTATHQRDYAETMDPRNMNQSMTRLGVVHSKFRKFMVLARFATHVLAVYVESLPLSFLALLMFADPFIPMKDGGFRISLTRMSLSQFGESSSCLNGLLHLAVAWWLFRGFLHDCAQLERTSWAPRGMIKSGC